MEQKKIERINELSKKAKNEGLTPKEKEEQQVLRREYLDAFKNNLRLTIEDAFPDRAAIIQKKNNTNNQH